MGGKFIDITGQRFGKWTVLQKSQSKGGMMYWKCQCDCGTVKDICGRNLRNGSSLSCGCSRRKKAPSDLTGLKFGRLTVLEKAGTDGKNSYWKCKCDCGTILKVVRYDLVSGHTQSCGCLQKERTSDASRRDDVIGKKFGKLIVLPQFKMSQHKQGTLRKCRCECGNIIYVPTRDLVSGHTRSCGCLTQSIGVSNIQKILTDNNIQYVKEKSFETCVFKDTNKKARFDFYIENKYLLEFDGKQHFYQGKGYYDNQEQFLKTKQHDLYKNNWCKENNIPLIRIPYFKKDDVSLSDLLLESSNFII